MTVYDEIKRERDYQVHRWGTEADTRVNTPNDFAAFIAHHSTRWFRGGFAPYPTEVVDDYRSQMTVESTRT
jgi:hypothetical protein